MSLFPKDWALNSARPIERFYQPQFLDYHLSSHNVEQVNFVCYISSCKLAQNHQYFKVFCEIYNFFFLLALLNRNLVWSYILDMTKEKRRNFQKSANIPYYVAAKKDDTSSVFSLSRATDSRKYNLHWNVTRSKKLMLSLSHENNKSKNKIEMLKR